MMKKKTWNAGCMILISLMICTILSIRIEKWMQIPVEIATISQTEEEKLNSTIRIPKSCYNTDTNMIFLSGRARKCIRNKISRLFKGCRSSFHNRR